MKEFVLSFTIAFLSLLTNVQPTSANCGLPNIENAIIYRDGKYIDTNKVQEVQSGVKVRVQCHRTFVRVDGPEHLVCRNNGHWGPRRIPRCVTIESIYEQCGIGISPQVYGGTVAMAGEFPWMVRLEITRVAGRIQDVCGGSLINREWILTAAHCLNKSHEDRITAISIKLGRTHFSNYTSPGQVVRSSLVHIIHPEYNKGNVHNNDVALIRMNTPITYTQRIRPICLPTTAMCISRSNRRRSNGIQARLDGCRRGIIAGWGLSADRGEPNLSPSLKKLHLNVLPNRICEVNHGVGRLSDSQFCAGSGQNSSSCLGDSGGPLMCEKNTKMHALGIVSYGTHIQCGVKNEPTVYTRVCEVLRWVKNTSSCLFPRCKQAAVCDRPPSIRNGHRGDWDGTKTIGSVIPIECYPNFRLNGPNEIKCQTDGFWSSPPQCMHINSCVRPGNVPNGFFLGGIPSLDIGANITVQCDPNFVMQGVSHITCQTDGSWSEYPHCIKSSSHVRTVSSAPPGPGSHNSNQTVTIVVDSLPKTITHPANGGNYGNDERICWQFTAPRGHVLRFKVFWKDIEQEKEWLVIEDGTNFLNILNNCLNGSIFYTSSTIGKLCFSSDSDVTGKGFKVRANAVKLPPGKTFAYPSNRNYTSYEHRCWDMKVGAGKVVKMKILYKDLEVAYDKLVLFDGSTQNSTAYFLGSSEVKIGDDFRSSSNVIKLCFQTNGFDNRRGFRLHFQEVDAN